MPTNTGAWWNYPRIDNFGQIDPEGNYYKPDTNVQIPGGYPVVTALPGVVTSVQQTSWGQNVITIKLDSALNQYATHTFYEHLGGVAPGIVPGTHVTQGQLIAYNNPSGSVPLGFGLYSGDIYGSGDAWAILQSDLRPGGAGYLNPIKLIEQLQANQPVTQTGGAAIGGIDQLSQVLPQLPQILGAISFTGLLGALILGAVVVSVVIFVYIEVK